MDEPRPDVTLDQLIELCQRYPDAFVPGHQAAMLIEEIERLRQLLAAQDKDK